MLKLALNAEKPINCSYAFFVKKLKHDGFSFLIERKLGDISLSFYKKKEKNNNLIFSMFLSGNRHKVSNQILDLFTFSANTRVINEFFGKT